MSSFRLSAGPSYVSASERRKPSPHDQRMKHMGKVRKGDILISGGGVRGYVGHAALMVTDEDVLEMEGGKSTDNDIRDNNRKIDKYDWLDCHSSDVVTVYRNKDSEVAHDAAEWAYRKYYNAYGGSSKTEHITYRLTPDMSCIDPSYCSKLVIQAYYLGTGDREVISPVIYSDGIIVPTSIPIYFLVPYRLENKGSF